MAFSKLLNGDAEEFTPAQAGAQFAAEAKRIAEEQNIDIAKAWKIAKSLHPEAFARLCEGGKPNVTLANSAEKVKRDALTKDYADKFNKALRDCNNDPIRAHAIVMKQMNEAETQPLDNASLQDLFNKNGLNTVTMGLGMQNQITADEFAVAWKAIGGKITPSINFKAMFNALTSFVVGKENVSVPAARAAVAERFPVLASKCGYSPAS
jgi:DNA-binding IscR family transcriptional regulator